VAFVENWKKELLVTIDFTLVHPWPQVDGHKDDLDFVNINMEDKVASLLGEVATHDVLKQH
jgi:hypothetical protein